MTYRIRIFLKDVIVHAQLHDGAAAKDFIQSLPMTVSMEDYDSKEKIFYPPAKLSTTGSPKSYAGKKVISPITHRGEISRFSMKIPSMQQGSYR